MFSSCKEYFVSMKGVICSFRVNEVMFFPVLIQFCHIKDLLNYFVPSFHSVVLI